MDMGMLNGILAMPSAWQPHAVPLQLGNPDCLLDWSALVCFFYFHTQCVRVPHGWHSDAAAAEQRLQSQVLWQHRQSRSWRGTSAGEAGTQEKLVEMVERVQVWCGHCECDRGLRWPLRTGLGGNARFSHTYRIVCCGVCVLFADFLWVFPSIGEKRREIVFVWGMCVRCSVVQYRHQQSWMHSLWCWRLTLPLASSMLWLGSAKCVALRCGLLQRWHQQSWMRCWLGWRPALTLHFSGLKHGPATLAISFPILRRNHS